MRSKTRWRHLFSVLWRYSTFGDAARLLLSLVIPLKLYTMIETIQRKREQATQTAVLAHRRIYEPPGAIMKALTVHPGWATMLKPLHMIEIIVIVVVAAFANQSFWPPTIATIPMLVVLGLAVATITARDIRLHLVAKKLVDNTAELAAALSPSPLELSKSFSVWLYWHGDRTLLPLLERSHDLTSLAPKQRYWLAWHHEKYMLASVCGTQVVRPITLGASLLFRGDLRPTQMPSINLRVWLDAMGRKPM